MKSNKNKTKKSPRDKYNLGSFVTQNQEVASQYQSQIDSIARPQGGNVGRGVVSGLGTGASVGASIGSVVPVLGTAVGGAIGAVVGGIGGLFGGLSRDQKERRRYSNQVNQLNDARSNITQDLYLSSLDTNNENPYGVYQDGGEVNSLLSPNPTINIEKGELQVDPTTGKILRKFKGINPETGGLYKDHNKNGKDPEDNMVTAEEGTFIITKKEASKYEEAVDNNDKLYQNTIMSNIRNQKAKEKPTGKYNTGGIVDPNLLPNLNSAGINFNRGFNIPTLNANANLNVGAPNISRTGGGVNFGNIASTALNYLPSLYNIAQGSRSANTLPYTPIRINPQARQNILANLPTEVSANPALNNIRNARTRAGRTISSNTSNPTIARANRLALEGNFLNAENDALYNTQLTNNQIRSQRANVLAGLDAQDQNRTAQNVQSLNNTFLTNRQMQLAKDQQLNYGISQFGQMYQNNRRNRQLQNMDQRTLDLLQQIFPNTGNLFDSFRGGNS